MIEACKIIVNEYELCNPDLTFVDDPDSFRLYWAAREYVEKYGDGA